MENILYELWEWWIRKGERQWLDRIINLESGGLRAIRSSAMRLSQPFHSAFQTFDAMRAHYTFKHWHGSNFSCQNLPTLNSWFPSTSVHLLFNAPISTMIEDDRKRIRRKQRPDHGPEFGWNPVQDWFRRPTRGTDTRISVACKSRFITCYPSQSLSPRSSPSSSIFPRCSPPLNFDRLISFRFSSVSTLHYFFSYRFFFFFKLFV